MRYDHVADKLFITCHFTKMMCRYTDLIGKHIIDNIKRHDYDCEKDDFGVEIDDIVQHELVAYEVARISNCLVECR